MDLSTGGKFIYIGKELERSKYAYHHYA